ncbi:MAG: ribosome-binding factor A [Anaerolineaceae bacterium 4572_5.1]|nr:MAG: ribosome-binding factor A [Anaerolineaceae bacterium 4572_5.1]RLD07860.1 MAG: 30S ribosome-binding factor RbfA [Chloroflexota bacterium]
MVSEMRLKRIADRIVEELTIILLRETADPRLDGVTITHIRLDPEVSFADIYVSALEGEDRSEEILAGLKHARGYLRSELAHRISHLRSFPKLRFHWDETLKKANRIDALIAQLDAEEIAKKSNEHE